MHEEHKIVPHYTIPTRGGGILCSLASIWPSLHNSPYNYGQTFPNVCPVDCVSLSTYLPPVWVILVAILHDVPPLEGQSQSLARDLIVKTTIVVKVGTHIFLCVCVCVCVYMRVCMCVYMHTKLQQFSSFLNLDWPMHIIMISTLLQKSFRCMLCC